MLLFPTGIKWGDGGFGTGASTVMTEVVSVKSTNKNQMAARTIQAWNHIRQWLRDMHALKEANLFGDLQESARG